MNFITRLLCLLVFTIGICQFCPAQSPPNITAAEYFVDTDPGFGNATGIPVATPSPNITDNTFGVALGAVSQGVHVLFIRSRDANGKWSITNRFVFYKPSSSAGAPAANIVKAEYFFDTDPGFGNAINIPLTAGVDVPDVAFAADISSLSVGVHTLYLRSRNADGKWSITNRQVLYKPSGTGAAAAANIVKAEYFFDTDPGFGSATDIPVTAGVDVQNVNFTADLSTLSVGVHTLYIRSKNADGKWSITNRQILYKPNPSGSGSAATNIVKAEYFFDADPGFGSATNIPVTAGTDVQNVSFAASLEPLSVGVHQLFIRSQNADGRWSITNRQILYKPNPANGLPPADITNIEYFIDTDPGIGKAVPIVVNAAPAFTDFVAPVNISGLSVGDHRLFIRSRASSGWSITNVYTFPISATAPAPFINVNAITKTVMCAKDSVKLSFDARGTYNAGNVFNAELSDANGSFTSPVIIGSYTGTSSAIIACKLPDNVVGGTNFRVRVSSTNPVVTGISGSDALTIGNKSQPQTISGPVNVNGTLNYTYSVPTVTGSTWNWMITQGTQQSGSNTSSIGLTWMQPPAQTSTGTIKLVETNYGCVGDTSILTATIYKLSIGITAPVSACKAFDITINANADGAFGLGNTITAQLSDASGSFAAPVAIGSVALVGNGLNQAAVINATIPLNIPNGTAYRIRLMSSTGSFVGDTSAAVSIIKPDIGADLTRSKCTGFGYDLTQNYTDASLTYTYFTQTFGVLAQPGSVDAGTYQVIGSNSIGCKDTATVTVTNYPQPAPAFTVNASTQCVNGNSFVFTNTSGISSGSMTYQWSFGDNTTSTETAPAKVYSAAGTYIVKLVVTSNNGCKDSVTQSITVNPKPAPGFTVSNNTQCLSGNNFAFTNTSTITAGTISYQWSFGDNSSSTATDPAHTYTAAGTYSVKLVVTSNNGCKDSVMQNVTVNPPPNLGPDRSITVSCAGGTADITTVYNTSGYSSVTYSTSDPQHAAPGMYTLRVTNSSNCADTAIITVLDASIVTVPTTPDNIKVANRECTDQQGWTHYYNDNGTPTDFSDDIRILSIKKNGNSVGTVGDGTFQVKVAATQGAGSGHAVRVNSPFVPQGTSFYSMNRYWNITPTTQPVTPVNIRFYYNSQDLTDVNGDYPSGTVTHTQLNMYKLQGGNPDPTTNWTGATAVSYYQNGSTPTVATWVHSSLGNDEHQAEFQVTDFSGGGAGATSVSALPVTFVNFDVTGEKDKVKITWTTATEINSKDFTIQRSLDGVTFETTGKVPAAGNSTTLHSYVYNDVEAMQFKGRMLFYRILQTDVSGLERYTDIKKIRIANFSNSLRLLYNPVRSEAILKYQSVERGKVQVRMIDQSGKLVMLKEAEVQEGSNQIMLKTGSLAKGIYEVQVMSSDDRQHVRMMKE